MCSWKMQKEQPVTEISTRLKTLCSAFSLSTGTIYSIKIILMLQQTESDKDCPRE